MPTGINPLEALVRDTRGAVAVEYIILAGCVALAITLGFQRFGGEVSAKVECQARAVLSLSMGGCSAGEGAGVDFSGVEIAGAVNDDSGDDDEGDDDEDCRPWNPSECIESVAELTSDARETAGEVIDTLSSVDDNIGDALESYYTGIASIVTDPLRDLAPLVGLGGDGAPGVGEAWGSLLTNNVVSQLVTGDFQGAWESTLSGVQSFVGYEDFRNGDFFHGTGTLLGNVALTAATFGVGGVYKIGFDQAADAAGTARRSDGDGDDSADVPAAVPPAPLGRGSTVDPSKGRYAPRNLREQLAVEEAIANPQAGNKLPITLNDPRWPSAEGWVKMERVIDSGGQRTRVHYVRNERTGEIDDFKIVDDHVALPPP